ncbi:leucine-rich repeat, immunoglobulin-like domain and transmembrane domain-containing protein 3b [Megalops cyprinoides]|uniref:leucine-rich repeat, immunoglobulin-like domain and transmembrane domain-containing protein 3b n=1 Tax=Megalops cyprinoides TaxID=118141 RepID=UPI0018654723|nr:leucine-rich repeat, immunoglobulin-like domain and transmembrane domain-containing protein 3b [Megalops cyprinoides]
MHRLFYIHIFLCSIRAVHCFCPALCTCIYHGRSDGTGTRSVLCNDPDMSDIPTNVPVDTVKLRVEKTVVRRIPTEAFYYLPELRYLWVTYNAVTAVDAGSFYNLKALRELRLDGNLLSVFPWESLRETPALRTLDLHNNRLTSIPAEAARYLGNVTYLDVSSNKLTTLPSDLMDIWPPFSGPVRSGDGSQKVVLGLQDNPWFCDCRISKLLELSKMAETAVVLLDPFLVCSGPENLVGVPFQLAELDQCLKPSVMTSATKITSPLGSNVLLRCDATGYPTPTLVWTKSNGPPVNNTVVEETPGEGTRWSIMSLNGVLYKDAGEYRCRAKNVAGTSEAYITLSVVGVVTTTPAQGRISKPGAASQASTDSVLVTGTGGATAKPPAPPPAQTTTPPASTPPSVSTKTGQQRALPIGEQQGQGSKRTAADARGKATGSSSAQKPPIRDIRVAEVVADSVALLWTADGLAGDTPLTVVYSPYEEKEKLTVTTETGVGRLVLQGLRPRMKYMACLIAKGGQSRKDQCVTFSTADVAGEESLSLALLIVSGVACTVAVPLIGLLIYKITCLYRHKAGSSADHDQDTYVKFETLSLKQRTMGSQGNDLWARRQTQESERMLLFSRSSIDSQMTYKSDSSRSEYLC